jgi:predicted RecA/RadA family phage recombinase
MKTYVQPGKTITHTVGADITAGTGLLIGAALFGVATADAKNGEECEFLTEGVVEIGKTSALAITKGDVLYWDATNKVVNKTAASQALVGVAVEAAANPSATVKMKLRPVTPA